MLCLALASAWFLGSSFAVVFGSGFGIGLVFRFEFRFCIWLWHRLGIWVLDSFLHLVSDLV